MGGGDDAQRGQKWAKMTMSGRNTGTSRFRMEIKRGALPGFKYGWLACLRCGEGSLIRSRLFLLLLGNIVNAMTTSHWTVTVPELNLYAVV